MHRWLSSCTAPAHFCTLFESLQNFLRPSDTSSNLLFVLWLIFPPLFRRIDIGWWLVIGTREHWDDRQHNRFNRVDGWPALTGLLITTWIIAWSVQNGDANSPVGIYVWVPYFCSETDSGRGVGVVLWENHQSVEETSLIQSIRRAHDADIPLEDVRVIDQPRGEALNWVFCYSF